MNTLMHYPLMLWALGLIVGGLGTLVGAGGGFVLVPLLLLLFPDLTPAQITAISLAVVALNSTSGSIAYARQQRVDFDMGWKLALAMIPGMVGGVYLASAIPRRTFQVLFGVLLLFLAAYLVVKPRGSQEGKGPGGADTGAAYPANASLAMLLSAGTGLLAGLLGIGGGPFHVPLLIYILRYPVFVATATSQFALAVMSWGATLLHLWRGEYLGVSGLLVALGLGAVAGAQGGAWLSQRVHDVLIVRTLGVVLGTVGLRLML